MLAGPLPGSNSGDISTFSRNSLKIWFLIGALGAPKAVVWTAPPAVTVDAGPTGADGGGADGQPSDADSIGTADWSITDSTRSGDSKPSDASDIVLPPADTKADIAVTTKLSANGFLEPASGKSVPSSAKVVLVWEVTSGSPD